LPYKYDEKQKFTVLVPKMFANCQIPFDHKKIVYDSYLNLSEFIKV